MRDPSVRVFRFEVLHGTNSRSVAFTREVTWSTFAELFGAPRKTAPGPLPGVFWSECKAWGHDVVWIVSTGPEEAQDTARQLQDLYVRHNVWGKDVSGVQSEVRKYNQ